MHPSYRGLSEAARAYLASQAQEPEEPEVTFWDEGPDDYDDYGDFEPYSESFSPNALGAVANWFRKRSYKGAHR